MRSRGVKTLIRNGPVENLLETDGKKNTFSKQTDGIQTDQKINRPDPECARLQQTPIEKTPSAAAG